MKNKFNILKNLTAMSFAFFSFESAIAATATTSFATKVIVGAYCQVSATDMDFGNLTDFEKNIDTKGSLRVYCTDGLPFQIGLDKGLYGNGVYERYMQNQVGTGEQINYQIYLDDSFSRVWGDNIDKDTFQDKGRGDWVTYTTFGRIPAQKGKSQGLYSDRVNIVITY